MEILFAACHVCIKYVVSRSLHYCYVVDRFLSFDLGWLFLAVSPELHRSLVTSARHMPRVQVSASGFSSLARRRQGQ